MFFSFILVGISCLFSLYFFHFFRVFSIPFFIVCWLLYVVSSLVYFSLVNAHLLFTFLRLITPFVSSPIYHGDEWIVCYSHTHIIWGVIPPPMLPHSAQDTLSNCFLEVRMAFGGAGGGGACILPRFLATPRPLPPEKSRWGARVFPP